ncbi:MAG: sensor histidine kinase [Candidatus Hodarchaeales archaeon]
MIPILAIIAFITLYLTTLLSLHAIRKNVGYGPLYAFVGTTVAFFNFFAPADVIVTIANEISFALTSNTLVIGVIATSFLLYLTDGIQRVRKMILAILIAELFTFIYPVIATVFVQLDPTNVIISNQNLSQIYNISYVISLSSTITILFDCLFVVTSFQFVLNRMPKNRVVVYVTGSIALIGASVIDAVLFPIITVIFGYPYSESILVRLPMFVIVSSIYAIVITIYAHIITQGKYFHYITSRSSLALLVGEETVDFETFLAEKRRAEILFNLMSHDLNNALQITSSAIELLKSDHPELVDEFPVQKLVKSFIRMKKISDTTAMIGGLQYISEDTIFSERLNMSIFCKEMISSFKNSMTEDVIVIFTDESDEKLVINFNPLLRVALMGILQNAVIHNQKEPNSKEVILKLESIYAGGRKQASITISDNGKGFSEELTKILLDPLEQISKRTGLGFVILKLAVDLSGGTYIIINKMIEGKNSGGQIEVRLPAISS